MLVSAFDIINYLNFLPYNIEEKFGNEWLWSELLKKLQSAPRTSNLSLIFFDKPSVNSVNLLSNWKESEDFQKWLIWLWLKFETKAGYLANVMQQSKKL